MVIFFILFKLHSDTLMGRAQKQLKVVVRVVRLVLFLENIYTHTLYFSPVNNCKEENEPRPESILLKSLKHRILLCQLTPLLCKGF